MLTASIARPDPGAIYNVCDDEPAPPEQVLETAATLLGVPVPPAEDYATAEMTPMARSFYAESKRVANDRIKRELGVQLRHPDYRSGSVIMSLWAGLAAYMKHNSYETMLGCASVAMVDGGHYAANLYCSLRDNALTAPEYRAFAHTPLPVEELQTGADVAPPPLVKGYLRLGAKICGAPAWDPDFNTADFLTLLRLTDINARYARHFLGDASPR